MSTATTIPCEAQQLTCGKIIIVFDISESMYFQQRLINSKAALNDWLTYDVPYGTYVGLVPFEFKAHIDKGFALQVVDSSSLPNITKTINSLTSGGGTCIGEGLQAALHSQTLLNNTNDGNIILIGDGIDGCSTPPFNQLTTEYARKNTTVYALSVGNGLDNKVENITKVTGGKVFDVPDTMKKGDFNGILRQICKSGCGEGKT